MQFFVLCAFFLAFFLCLRLKRKLHALGDRVGFEDDVGGDIGIEATRVNGDGIDEERGVDADGLARGAEQGVEQLFGGSGRRLRDVVHATMREVTHGQSGFIEAMYDIFEYLNDAVVVGSARGDDASHEF